MRSITVSLALVVAAACGSAPVAGPAPQTPATLDGAPAQFAAVTGDGAVVIADTATGRVVRRLVEPSAQPVGSLAMVPGGDTIFYAMVPDGECGELFSIGIDGGDPVRIGDGDSIAVSPDGRRLAWTQYFRCPRANTLTVQDRSTGGTRIWTSKEELPELGGVIEWDAASATVFLLACGVDSCGPVRLDPASGSRWDTAPWVGTEIDGREFSWGSTVRRGSNLVVDVGYGDTGGDERYPVVEVDPAGKEIVAELVPDGRGMTPLDFDETGMHMLLIDDDRLVRWRKGVATPVGRGFTDAVWIEPKT